MSGPALAWHQFRYDQRIFWRNPASVFFTVMLPLLFLLIFASIFGGQTISERGNLPVKTYYVPGIMTLAVVSATLVSLAIGLVEMRESGRLKRTRSTPLPTWAFVAGRVGNAVVTSFMMAVLVTLVGRILYGVAIPTSTIPAVVVTLIVGAFSFSTLGFALASAIPSFEAAPPITNFTVLPLYFLSGVLHPRDRDPRRCAQHRQRVSDQALLRVPADRLRSLDHRCRLRVRPPAGGRVVGHRRAVDRGPHLQLGTPARLEKRSSRHTRPQ